MLLNIVDRGQQITNRIATTSIEWRRFHVCIFHYLETNCAELPQKFLRNLFGANLRLFRSSDNISESLFYSRLIFVDTKIYK